MASEVKDIAEDLRDEIALVSGVQVWRSSEVGRIPQGAAHKGVVVFPRQTEAAGQISRRRLLEGQWVRTTFDVHLHYRLGPNFGEGEDAALDLAKAIRFALTRWDASDIGAGFFRLEGPLDFRSQTNGAHPSAKGWYRIILVFKGTHLIDKAA